MNRELLGLLFEATLAGAGAIVLVLVMRGPIRRWFGASAAYAAWLLVPAALLAVALPAAIAAPVVQPIAGILSAQGFVTAHVRTDSVDPAPWLIALWAAGFIASAWRMFRQQGRFHASLGKLSLRSDGLLQCEATEGLPAVVGWRARIVLPADFEQRYESRQRPLVIFHEQVHRQRGDLWVNAFASFLRCVFWFNPLVHVAAMRLRYDQELACDAVVLRTFPDRRRTYGDALLMAELAAHPLPVGCHWLGSHPLKERIFMLKRPLPSKQRRLSGLLIVFTLTLAGAWTAWATQPARIAGPSAANAASTNLTAKSAEVSIRAAALDVANRSGLRIANPGVLPDDRMLSFKFQDIPAATALELIAEESGATLHIDGDLVAFAALQKPKYPINAEGAREGGLVMLKVLVGVDGQAREVEYVAGESTVSEDSAFTLNAIEAAAQWQFQPRTKDGKAVPGWVMVPVRFEPPTETPEAGPTAEGA